MQGGFLSAVLGDICRDAGYELRFFDDFGRSGCVIFSDGGRCFFKTASFDINRFGAAQIARDKDYCARALAQAGFNVVEGALTVSPDYKEKLSGVSPELGARWRPFQDAIDAAERFGFPVFVKPNDGAEGLGVAKIGSAEQLTAHLAKLYQRFDLALIQPAHPGRDFRVVVLEGEVACAYERRPLSVRGDGARTIARLLADHADALAGKGRAARIDAGGAAVAESLRAQGRSVQDIPAEGEEVELLSNANLSTGGAIVDRSKDIAPAYADLCRRAVAEIGLRFAGVDLICADIARFDAGHAILEINAGPGLHNFGAEGPAERATVRGVYARLLRAVEAERRRA